MASIAGTGSIASSDSNSDKIPSGLTEKEFFSKSKYNGLPANISSEGLPPPSISYQKKGSLYIWGRMADDSEVSALNTDDMLDSTTNSGALAKFGFRKLACLCGAIPNNDKKGESQLPESAQFLLSFDNVEGLRAEKVKKVCGGDSQIIIFTVDGAVYSCGYGTSALYKDVGESKGEIVPLLSKMEKHFNNNRKISIRDVECGSEHTILLCTNIACDEKTYKLYNFGGSQYFYPIPMPDMPKQFLFSCQDQGNIAIAYESTKIQNPKRCVYLWKNDAEGEIQEAEIPTSMKLQKTENAAESAVMHHRGVRDGIAESVSNLKRRGSLYTMMPLKHKNDDGTNGVSNGSSEKKVKSTYTKNIRSLKQVACGERSILFLTNDGRVYSSGNDYGTTQAMFNDDGTSQSIFKHIHFPKHIDSKTSSKCIKIANGGGHFAALFDDGKLYMWGRNQYGQVTSNSRSSCHEDSHSDKNVDLSKIFLSLSASRAFVADPIEIVLKDDFLVVSDEQKLKYFNGIQLLVKDVVCGKMHTTALTNSGQIFSWGRIPGAEDYDSSYPYPDLVGQYVLSIGSAPMFSMAVVQRPRLKIEGRVIDETFKMEIGCNMMDCKRAKFGKQSNFSSMYLPIVRIKYVRNIPNIDKGSCRGRAVLVCRPADGFPETTSFGNIAHEACEAGAEMLIFCCHKKDGKADLPVRAKLDIGNPLEKLIDIPVMSVNQVSGEYLGCPSTNKKCKNDINKMVVRLCWFGDGQ